MKQDIIYTYEVRALSPGEGFKVIKEQNNETKLLCFFGYKKPKTIRVPADFTVISMEPKKSGEQVQILFIKGHEKQSLGNFVSKIINVCPSKKWRYRHKGYCVWRKNQSLPVLHRKKKLFKISYGI